MSKSYAVLAALLLLLPSPALADTLIDNIAGLSLDRTGQVTRFSAMVIDAHGRIAQVLARGERPARTDFREDGRGRVVMAGFVDAHVRLMALGLAQLTLDLSDTRTLAEAQEKLRAYAAANPDRPWIVGRGWDAARWGLARSPTASELDAAVADRPVWLESADGSAGWANGAALSAAGVTARTPDPAGGRIERLSAGRAPAGVLIGTAADLVTAKIPPARAADLDVALMKAQDLLVRQGVTAVADMGTDLAAWMTYRRAGDEGRLRLRIVAYADGVPDMLTIGGSAPTPWLYDDRLRLAGLALRLDGSLASGSAWVKSPYPTPSTGHGLPRLNGTQLRNLMSRAAMDDFQIAVEGHGDAAVAESLSAIDELSPDYRGDRRWRIEGAEVIDPADLPRLAEHVAIVSLQVAWPAPAPWTGIAGARWALGSGAPSAPASPFARAAVALEHGLDSSKALAAATSGAAYAAFADGRFGELKAGERADFVMLDGDPLTADAAGMRAIRVMQTWIGGQKVYDAAPGTLRAADAPGR